MLCAHRAADRQHQPFPLARFHFRRMRQQSYFNIPRRYRGDNINSASAASCGGAASYAALGGTQTSATCLRIPLRVSHCLARRAVARSSPRPRSTPRLSVALQKFLQPDLRSPPQRPCWLILNPPVP